MPYNLKLISEPTDKRLHEKVKRVKDVHSAATFGIVQAMKEFQTKVGGIGLAANQVGINQAIITAYHEGTGEIVEFINPRLVHSSLDTKHISWQQEGCLSHPGILAEVARYEYIQFYAQRLNQSKEMCYEATGMLARIIQHEICHLEGMLITDMGIYVRNIVIEPTGQKKMLEAFSEFEAKGQEDYIAE